MIPANPSNLFSEQQRIILVIVPGVAAVISVVSSLAIVYTLLTDPVERKKSPFQRLFLGISIMDIAFSAPQALMGGWAVPSDGWTSVLAHGNQTSCNVMGFWMLLGVTGQLMYSASLAIYHVLVVRYRWTNRTIATCIEPFFHGLSWLLPLITSISLLCTDFINSTHLDPGTCIASTNPPNCLQMETVDCVRGHEWQALHALTITFFSILVVLTWIIMIWVNALLWLEVRSTERRMQRYGRSLSQAGSFHLTRKVGNQGMLYVGCFTASNIFTLIRILVLYPIFETSYANRSLYFGIQVISLPMLQLQGFFHALVFFTPRWPSLLQTGRALGVIGEWMRHSGDKEDSTEIEVGAELSIYQQAFTTDLEVTTDVEQ